MFGNDNTQPVNNGLMGLAVDDQSSQSTSTPASEPSTGSFMTEPTTLTNDAAPETDATNTNQPIDNSDGLLDIKKEALMELSPLVNQLDQSADEKFQTLMMMIQASDNKSLVPQAFEAAKTISDDKKRARALLDVVNEINYFTQKDK